MSNEVKCMFMFVLNLSLISELFQYAITIALKVSLLVKKKRIFFCSWKVSTFFHAASFANARNVSVSEFQVKN